MGEGLKICRRCKKLLVLRAFSLRKGASDGLQSHCKKCQSDIQRLNKAKIRLKRSQMRELEREALAAKKAASNEGPSKCDLIRAERERLSALRFGRRNA